MSRGNYGYQGSLYVGYLCLDNGAQKTIGKVPSIMGHPAYLQEIRVEEAFKAGPKAVSQWLERQQCKLALPSN